MGGKGAVRRASNFPQRACTRSAALCARSVCGEEAQGRARPGCQLRQGKGPPTHRPTRVAPYPEGREGEKGKDAAGSIVKSNYAQ